MSKPKYFAILALALLLILAGALLPRLIAAAGDRAVFGKPGFNRIQSVELELHKNIPSMGKLALMPALDGAVEIQATKASRTQQQILDACRQALQPYIRAGLMDQYREWQVTMRTFLVQGETANGILWTVTILDDVKGEYCIDTVMDDETGKLLRLHVYDQVFRGSELRTEYLYTLAELFFMGLDFSEQEYPPFETDDLQEVRQGSNAVRYRFGDAVYGEVTVDLWVCEYGFYVDFPQREVTVYE